MKIVLKSITTTEHDKHTNNFSLNKPTGWTQWFWQKWMSVENSTVPSGCTKALSVKYTCQPLTSRHRHFTSFFFAKPFELTWASLGVQPQICYWIELQAVTPQCSLFTFKPFLYSTRYRIWNKSSPKLLFWCWLEQIVLQDCILHCSLNLFLYKPSSAGKYNLWGVTVRTEGFALVVCQFWDVFCI